MGVVGLFYCVYVRGGSGFGGFGGFGVDWETVSREKGMSGAKGSRIVWTGSGEGVLMRRRGVGFCGWRCLAGSGSLPARFRERRCVGE